MTDQIPADKVQKIAADMRAAMRRVEDDYPDGEFLMDMSDYIQDLDALLPSPPRPTLADMTPEERAACRWMQADTESEGRTVILQLNASVGRALMLDEEANLAYVARDEVTPRPDLPPMEWPGDGPAPVPTLPGNWRLADHEKRGRVIVTNPTLNHDGRVYFVLPVGRNLMGFDWRSCDPAELTYIDTGQKAEDVTPVKVGDVIESADDPRLDALPVGTVLVDCDGETVAKRSEAWAGLGYIPIESEGDEFGPWTVRRIGWEADQ